MCAILTTHNMDIVWDDDPDFIDVKMILFTEGGEFLLKNEVLYLVEKEEEQEQPPVWGWSRPGKAPNLERHRVMYSHVLYNNFWGPTPVYNKLYFKKFSSLRLACLVRLMKGLPCTTRIIHSTYCVATTMGMECTKHFCNVRRQNTSAPKIIEQHQ